jgi:acyl-coenzyme A synthetase/AMP-(fatty) acid ligase/pimeloyl-ACP methyl ester carboxylesterase
VTSAVSSGPGDIAALESMPGLEPGWSRFVTIRDADGAERRWHLLDNGAEPAIGTMLCVHGNPTWSYLWRRFVALAPPGWRVVAPDQLGMGWSDRTARPRTLASRVDDLGRLSDALGIDGPTIVVAHDWGGPIALGWALAHRPQLRGIVLTNTGVTLAAKIPPLIRLARSKALRESVCVRTPLFVGGATALSSPALPADVRRAFAAPYRSTERRRAVGEFVADIPLESDHPSAAELDRIVAGIADLRDVPVLVLWGARDPVFTETFLHDLETRLSQAVVHRHARASHLVSEDVPEVAEQAWRWARGLGHEPVAGTRPEAATTRLGAALAQRRGSSRRAIVEVRGRRVVETSWAELDRRVGQAAAGLARLGVRNGSRVALLVPPGADLTVAAYGCWRVGATIVAADAGLGLRSLGNALRSAAPDYVIGIRPTLAIAKAIGVPGRRVSVAGLTAHGAENAPEPAEPAAGEGAVLFTSGATGPPKGVVYRHPQLLAQLELVRTVCGITDDDRMVAAFAPFALYGPALGIAVAVPDMDVTRPATLTATALARAVAAVGGTVIFASPAALRNVAATADALNPDLREALSGVRRVLSAGAPVPVDLLHQVAVLMPSAELHTPYGMTEVLPVTDVTLTEIVRAGPGDGVCVGYPLPGVAVRLLELDRLGRPTGEPTDRAGTTGEILVSARHVKDRYDRLWVTERASRAEGGWHRTGDVGHLDDHGRLWVGGRLVHVISTAAGPLTPVGLELRLESVTGVRAAAVVGVGPVGTQQVVAIVVPDSSTSGPLAEPGLAAAIRAAADVPIAAVLTVTRLPVDIRHASKVDRTRLARWASDVLAGERPGRP